MDFSQLEYIITISQEGSLVGAAEKLYISQPALSQFVQKLERSLGIQLFQRGNRGWKLTPAGEIYINAAKEILAIRDRAYGDMERIANGLNGHFSIGLGSGRGVEMFAHVYPEFKTHFPGVSIDVVEGKSASLKKQTLAGEIDIFFGSGDVDNPHFAVQPLCSEIFVLAVPHSHPLAEKLLPLQKYGVPLSVCAEYPLVLVDRSVGQRALIDALFKQNGIKPQISFESGSSSTIFNMVHKGLGISIIPMYYAKTTDEVVYFRTIPEQSRNHYALYLKDRVLSRAEVMFIDMVRTYYRQTCDVSLLERIV